MRHSHYTNFRGSAVHGFVDTSSLSPWWRLAHSVKTSSYFLSLSWQHCLHSTSKLWKVLVLLSWDSHFRQSITSNGFSSWTFQGWLKHDLRSNLSAPKFKTFHWEGTPGLLPCACLCVWCHNSIVLSCSSQNYSTMNNIFGQHFRVIYCVVSILSSKCLWLLNVFFLAIPREEG